VSELIAGLLSASPDEIGFMVELTSSKHTRHIYRNLLFPSPRKGIVQYPPELTRSIDHSSFFLREALPTWFTSPRHKIGLSNGERNQFSEGAGRFAAVSQ
jgi:hypothetical protein